MILQQELQGICPHSPEKNHTECKRQRLRKIWKGQPKQLKICIKNHIQEANQNIEEGFISSEMYAEVPAHEGSQWWHHYLNINDIKYTKLIYIIYIKYIIYR